MANLEDRKKTVPGLHERLLDAEEWIENHQKKSIRHTTYFGVVAFVVGCLVLAQLWG